MSRAGREETEPLSRPDGPRRRRGRARPPRRRAGRVRPRPRGPQGDGRDHRPGGREDGGDMQKA